MADEIKNKWDDADSGDGAPCKHDLWRGNVPCLYCMYEVGLGPVARMPWDGPPRLLTKEEKEKLKRV